MALYLGFATSFIGGLFIRWFAIWQRVC